LDRYSPSTIQIVVETKTEEQRILKREPMIREMDEKQIAQIPSSEARAKEVNRSE
jgi:hypothetical protein